MKEQLKLAGNSKKNVIKGKLGTITQFIQKTMGIENPMMTISSEQRDWSESEVYSIQAEEIKEIQFFLLCDLSFEFPVQIACLNSKRLMVKTKLLMASKK